MSAARRLLSKSALIFALRVCGAGLVFLVQAAIARLWGAESLGDFLLVIAAANLLALAMPLGLQTVGTYFASEYRARGEGHHLRRFMRRAYACVGALGVLCLIAGRPLTAMMGEAGAHLAPLWMPTVLLAVGVAVVYVNTTVLIGLRRPLAGFSADMIVRPLLTGAAFALTIAVLKGPALAPMLWGLSLVYLVAAGLHLAYTARIASHVPGTAMPRASEPRRWWRYAAPWVILTLASDFFFDLNLVLLAGLLDREDLAIFGVATRIFALIAFATTAVYAQTLPDMHDAQTRADPDGFQARVGEANAVASALAVLLLCGVVFGGSTVLSFFGADFARGAAPLAVLSLALVVRAVFGPASLVLSMRERPQDSLPAVAVGLLALVGGNWLLVPAFGLMGAAISAFVAITLWSGTLWFTAWRRVGLDVSIAAFLRRPTAA